MTQERDTPQDTLSEDPSELAPHEDAPRQDEEEEEEELEEAELEAAPRSFRQSVWYVIRSGVWMTRWTLAIAILTILGLTAYLVRNEMETSVYQQEYFQNISKGATYSLEPGEAEVTQQAGEGPFDVSRGYSSTQRLIKSMKEDGFKVTAQARTSEAFDAITAQGFNPPYPEKLKAGLTLRDGDGKVVRAYSTPQRVWKTFKEIPEPVVQTLTFMENRELFTPKHRTNNPVVEWDRVAHAGLMYGLSKIGANVDVPGGSTLATQLEKFRHSPHGTTDGLGDKYQQMMSASIRVYRSGSDTMQERERIALHYLNGVPFASQKGYGPVIGMRDALWAYFGVDVEQFEHAMSGKATDEEFAAVYGPVLGLVIAQRAPTTLLRKNNEELARLMRVHLPMLVEEGVITPSQSAAVTASMPLSFKAAVPEPDLAPMVVRKEVENLDGSLAYLVGAENVYELKQRDLEVVSTIEQDAQSLAEEFLIKHMRDEEYLQNNGFYRGDYVLKEGQDVSKVNYSFTLYEATSKGNMLRVQVDTLDQPFNFNEQAKLDLGSTAKLRTLITYLVVIEELYNKHKDKTRSQLWQAESPRGDGLDLWVRRYLLNNSKHSLKGVLDEALERKYSASPYRRYFTGGGMHRFHNFKKSDNGRRYSAKRALAYSVNLPFINMMKDISDHYQWKAVDASILEEREHPQREVYVRRWVKGDAAVFLGRFWRKYDGVKKEDVLSKVHGKDGSSSLAALTITYRSITDEAEVSQGFIDYVTAALPEKDHEDDLPKTQEEWAALFAEHDATAFNWNERGYVASVHPLELWVAHEVYHNPKMDWETLHKNSPKAVDEAYAWLYKNVDSFRVNSKIRHGLEQDAFKEITKFWQSTGYPFEVIPTLASALGSSADRPSALSDLMGIILHGGERVAARRFSSVIFGEGTPYEVRFRLDEPKRERVFSREVAAAAREAIIGVVERGTARRASRTFMLPDPEEEGEFIRDESMVIGGKTGTGDHRQRSFNKWGHLLKEKFVSRSATFAFLVNERYFGVITINVEGEHAENYNYTSSMATEIFQQLFPKVVKKLEDDPNPDEGEDETFVRAGVR